jgi:hypothetical protein
MYSIPCVAFELLVTGLLLHLKLFDIIKNYNLHKFHEYDKFRAVTLKYRR